MRGPEDYINWEIFRGTEQYNQAMIHLLHGVFNTAGLFETDEAVDDYDSVKTMDDIREFCKKWDTQKKIDVEKEILDAEHGYTQTERAVPTEEQKNKGIDELLRKLGRTEEEIEALRKSRLEKDKPKTQ